jgi:hypothetical protein
MMYAPRRREDDMQTNVSGRLRRMPALTRATILMPIFEAVVNAIQAIHARGGAGQIRIQLHRDGTQLATERGAQPVQSCTIVDDGIGFNDENFASFSTTYSLHKEHIGGKGLGRFTWLKAFESVEVVSVYTDGKGWYERRFSFLPRNNGVTGDSVVPTTVHRQHTEIRMRNLVPECAAIFPRSLPSIAERIIEHCMLYFLDNAAPIIALSDDEDLFLLGDMYTRVYQMHAIVDRFAIGAHQFKVHHVRHFASGEREHRLHLCANYRSVESELLKRHIPALVGRLQEHERSFVWSSYISSAYFDERVDMERDRINIPQGDEETLDEQLGVPTRVDVRSRVVRLVRAHLEPLLRPIRQATEERVGRYVRNKAPRHRPILKHCRQVLDDIPPNATESTIEECLNRAHYEHEKTIRGLREELAHHPMRTADDFARLQARFNEYIDGINEYGAATLAQHVVYRRLMLDLLAESLKRDDKGDYMNEDRVHGIIFPLRHTSNDVLYEQQNLWIVDERLSFHWFLASDLPFNDMKDVVGVDGLGRADIIVFDRPHAFVEDKGALSSVVIVEFKKPMRADYSRKDPVTQVFEYIEKLRGGGQVDVSGRPIALAANARFYCYIICDITTAVENAANRATLTKSPDGLGFFGYIGPYNAYMEVISYTKLVDDAEKRNRILFEKLSLV